MLVDDGGDIEGGPNMSNFLQHRVSVTVQSSVDLVFSSEPKEEQLDWLSRPDLVSVVRQWPMAAVQ